ncbi:MAG: ankyrin repeat domain-containing protein, partial [Armatimonadota bacterium]
MSDKTDLSKLTPEDFAEMSVDELNKLFEDFTGVPVGDVTNPLYYNPPPDPFFDSLAKPETTDTEVQAFLDSGIDPNGTRMGRYSQPEHPLMTAVRAGNVPVATLLIKNGSDVSFVGDKNYSMLLNACFIPRELGEDRMCEMVELLLDNGADPNLASDYGEYPVRVSSRAGHFEVVRILLDRGASVTPLNWNELMHAVALGSLEDVKKAFDNYPDVELRDNSGCTALMLALKRGDVAKAKLLLQYGASPNSIPDAHGEPLHCAIQSGNREIVEFFLSLKAEYQPTGYEDRGPIAAAIDDGNREVIEFLIQSYVKDPSFQMYIDRALYDDEEGKFARLLLESGAHPENIRRLARRTVLGHQNFGKEELAKITPQQFLEGRSPYFGRTNPELVNRPFWLAMIRIGYSGYGARQTFEPDAPFQCGGKDPVWGAERFGQSITFLPDGRIIEIGGEHEDSYDPDFCIFNDVFVHHPNGSTDIYCYPKSVFPPTDFHSATLVGEWIYIIGCLGYHGERQGKFIPVYRLNTVSFAIEKVETRSSPPYQVYSHAAKLVSGDKIQIKGGQKLTIGKKKAFSR